MKISVLASGSKGNLTLIENNYTKILIDFGLSYKNAVEKLRQVNTTIEEIDAIFITHEHVDHIKGIETLIKKNKINIFMSHGTYEAVVSSKKIGITYENFFVIKSDQSVYINEFKITPFLVSHDAREPFGYIVNDEDKKLVYLTDSGYVSQINEEKIKNADAYIIETNHNIEMLMCTNRPWSLKQRIIGNCGHLCNEDALQSLLRVINEKTKYVYLAHISEEANNVDLLNLTVKEMFANCIYNNSIKFIVAKQYEISEISEI